MISTFLVLITSFVLGGSYFFPPSSLATFNEKIVAGDINALQSIIETNLNLIDSPFAKRYRNEGFLLAVRRSHAPIVELLLKNANVDAAVNNNEAIRLASANGNVDIVRMLLKLPEVDPAAMKNEALIKASKNGHIEVVRLLLAHPRVKSSARSYQAVFWASEMNHSDIVKLFVNNRGRIYHRDIDFETNFHILERAAQFGNIDLVQFLLDRPLFRRMVQLILYTDSLVSIRTVINAGYRIDEKSLRIFIQYARFNGNDDIVKYLTSLKGKSNLPINPSVAMTEQCVICLSDENLFEGYMTSCNHQFHAECLQQWISKHNTCPICRSSIL